MNNLMIFEKKQVEVFEWNGRVLFNPYHCGNCLELSESSVRNHLSKMNSKQAILLKNSDVRDKDIRLLNNAGEKFLTESGVYKLIFKSKKAEAERFQDWVTDEVLPQIRKIGSYQISEMSKELQAIFMVDGKTEQLKKDFEEFKDNAPLFNAECDELMDRVKSVVTKILGYKTSAYNDKSLRGRVYSDIQQQLRREFGVKKYKSIKRCQLSKALDIVSNYKAPTVLIDEITRNNNQVYFKDTL
nr:MAG TPA: repressor domain protein [Inoviridae sp.]